MHQDLASLPQPDDLRIEAKKLLMLLGVRPDLTEDAPACDPGDRPSRLVGLIGAKRQPLKNGLPAKTRALLSGWRRQARQELALQAYERYGVRAHGSRT